MAQVEGGQIVWDLDARVTKLEEKLASARSKVKETGDVIDKGLGSVADKIGKRFDALASRLDDVGNRMIKIGAAPTLALGFASNAAIQFEDSLADVRKTTGLTAEDTAKLGTELLNLSKNTRTSNTELLDIAKIAGQLGVATNQILPFTTAVNQAVVALGDEFTGGAEEVTRELGTLSNQFKLAGKDGEFIAESITKIGSAVNSLGASGQATGPYVTDFARRVGGIAPVVGLSIDKVLGLGASLQELGQSQEVAGTAIQQLLVQMGKNVGEFAKIAGVSGSQFSKLLREDVNEALLLVAEGVTKDTEGIDVLAGRLDGLGVDGARAVSVLANLGNNTDLVRKRQALASEEFAKGTSLLSEYEIKNKTTAAQMEKLRNNVQVLAITLGNALLPRINDMVDRLTPFIQGFADFVTAHPQIVTAALAVGASLTTIGAGLKVVSVLLSGIGPLLKTAEVGFILLGNAASLSMGLGLVKNFSDAAAAIKIFGTTARLAFLAASKGAIAFGLALLANPITWIILGIIAVVALLAVAWNKNWGDIQGKTKAVISYLSGAFGPLIETLKSFGGDAIRAVGDFVGFIQGIPARLTEMGTQIGTFFSNLGTGIVNFFTALPGRIVGFVAAIPGMILESFIRMGENIAYALGFMLGLVIFGVPKIVSAIVGFFVALPGQLMAIWDSISISIQLTWINIGNWLAVTIPNIINSIVTFFQNLPMMIVGALVLTYNFVVNTFTQMWAWLVTNVPKIIASVIQFFQQLPGRIWETVLMVKENLVTGFIDAWNALVAEVSQWPGRLYDWGVKIASSFVDGIKSAIGRIVDAFKGGLDSARKYIEGKSPPVAGPFMNIDKWGFNVGDAWVQGFKNAFSGLDRGLFAGIPFESPTLSLAGANYNQTQIPPRQAGNQEINVNIGSTVIREDADIESLSREIGFRVQTSPGYIDNG